LGGDVSSFFQLLLHHLVELLYKTPYHVASFWNTMDKSIYSKGMRTAECSGKDDDQEYEKQWC
jgi:hypothetical protein